MFMFTTLISSLLVIAIAIYMMFHIWRYAKCHMEMDEKAADKIQKEEINS